MSIAELEARELELEPAAGGLWSDALRRLVRNPGAIIGFTLVASLGIVAIFAPWIAPYDPIEQNLEAMRPVAAPARRASTCSASTTSVATSSRA